MGRIVLHHHGRLKEKSIVALYSIYEQRLKSRSIKIEFHSEKLEIQEYYDQISALDGEKIFLDERGAFKSSFEFADMIKESTLESQNIHFCIGPFDGWQGVLSDHDLKLSLSPMTLTHEFTAVLLLEQIYRAFEILRGSNYHKD
ncbi:MAG: 23S rRNA (pseudouridine(1915)-N(3))-methyltransferase RlmH [Candidatus Poseidoniales archaeon]